MVLLMEIARHSNHFKLSSNSSSIEIYRLHPSKCIVVSPRTVKGYLHKGFDQVRTVLTESSWELFCGAHCRSHFVMGPVGIEQSIWDHPEYQVWPRSHAPDPFVHGPWPISPVHSNAYIVDPTVQFTPIGAKPYGIWLSRGSLFIARFGLGHR